MGPVLSLADVNLENDVFADRVPHDTFALLRREAPVYWYDWPQGRGFRCAALDPREARGAGDVRRDAPPARGGGAARAPATDFTNALERTPVRVTPA